MVSNEGNQKGGGIIKPGPSQPVKNGGGGCC